MTPKERIEKLKAQQRQGKRLTQAQIIARLVKFFAEHDDHQKKQVGSCVYCADCSIRLYQGRL